MAEKTGTKRDIHGHAVYGDKNVEYGMNYLDHDIQYSEAEVFFQQAKLHGQAEFEDDHERNYTLSYNGDGTYTIITRKSSGGLFGGWF